MANARIATSGSSSVQRVGSTPVSLWRAPGEWPAGRSIASWAGCTQRWWWPLTRGWVAMRVP